ncbi:MAG: hypothetical protein RMM08_03740 [Armatimonadota bacterium]|nr:hypothetical protein [bacterium]MDW8320455.1 hypothetical protein [Armatimonadota bacterium]
MIPEPVAVTLRVTSVLDSLAVPYAISGSLASALYGIARATQDVDIIAELHPAHVPQLAGTLTAEFYIDDAAVAQEVARRGSFNLIHRETMFKVDIFVARDHPLDKAVLARARRQVLHTEPEVSALVITPEDVVVAKLLWYQQGREVSDKQWRDVVGILRVLADTLDRTYLTQFAQQLGVHDLMERAIAEANY